MKVGTTHNDSHLTICKWPSFKGAVIVSLAFGSSSIQNKIQYSKVKSYFDDFKKQHFAAVASPILGFK